MKKQDEQDKSKAEQADKENTQEPSDIELWKSKYMRALADYHNVVKRSREEIEEHRKFAAEVVLARFLSVADTLRRAKDHLKDQGVELAYKELLAVFSEWGVAKIDVLEKPFNPHEMECIEVGEGNENEVIEEVLPGYRLHDKILRVAQVKVGKIKEVL